jgi:hemolysin activation/secretion protein
MSLRAFLKRWNCCRYCAVILILAFWATAIPALAEEHPQPATQQEQDAGFTIEAFYFTGNTIFPDEQLRNVLASFTGPRKTSADVEKARDAIEKFYHEEGYPTALVNIPEQTIGGGVVTLQVIESRVGKVTVTANRHFATEKILKELPSLAPGEILYAPRLQKELAKLNSYPDLKITPAIIPAKEIGIIDVELKVADRLPLHGSLEINNRSSHDTTELRLSGMVKYDNLWQKDHSISFQYQTSPENTDEVQVYSASYIMPLPWEREQRLVLYGVHSDSNTTSKEFNTVGKGDIAGIRYLLPLQGFDGFAHTLTFGLDYKKFDEALNFSTGGGGSSTTPISYLPISLAYGASLADPDGMTQFSAALNASFRGLVSRQSEFEEKRFKGMSNYLFLTLGVERTQKLPAGLGLFLKLDGQLADHPLISNEQFAAGGMESVRGYFESEEMGDNAIHGTLEVSAPNVAEKLGLDARFLVSPYVFSDFAALEVKSPLPGQERSILIYGAGAGVRGYLFRSLEYQADLGFALADDSRTRAGDSRINFKVKYQF